MRIDTPPRFDLDVAVRGHGWFDLPPFEYDRGGGVLHLVPRVAGRPTWIAVTQPDRRGPIVVRVLAGDADLRSVVPIVRSCLRLDEDLEPLYRSVGRDPRLAWVQRRGAGRLLRAPTLWEDVVKMIATTNCSWALTRVIVRALVDRLGETTPPGGERRTVRSFPTPAAVADAGVGFLRDVARSGYRAPYLAELATRVATGELDLEALREPAMQDEVVRRTLRGIKGVGDYAADNLMRLLGRYQALALDSWCRARYRELYPRTRAALEEAIARRYARFRPYTGLAMWLDLTASWHDQPDALWP